MLYVFTGKDEITVRAQAHAYASSCAPKGGIDRIEAAHCTPEVLRDRIGAQSLFAQEHAVVVLDTPSEQDGALEAVCKLAPELAESPHTFIVIERALLAAAARPLKKHAAEYYDIAAEKTAAPFNIFTLADAYARRDKKSLWLCYMRAHAQGISDEEIVGTMLWQIKTLRLAARTDRAEDAGLKPFVYTKATRALRHVGEDAAEGHARSLVSLYHEARAGRRDMTLGLERWILSL